MANTKPLNKSERKWLEELQAILNRCPSKRLGFATIGDNDLTVFDLERYDEITDLQDSDNCDFIPAAESIGAVFDLSLEFPSCVESTSG